MSNHIEWGDAAEALYTLHSARGAEAELEADAPVDGPYVLGLWNSNGDGLALEGTRPELLAYLRFVIAHVERETDPRAELDQALKRLHHLREQRAEALDTSNLGDVARLDEQEVDLLNDVAEAAEIVNEQL